MRSYTFFYICIAVSVAVNPVIWHMQTPENPFEKVICRYLDSAQQRLWVGLYRITSMACVRSLIRAKQRGVDVRILLDRGQNDLPIAASLLGKLKVAVIPVWWLGPEPLMHHKIAIVDNTVITGSVNWTRSGFFANAESCIVFDETDVVSDYVTHFNTLLRRAAGFSERTKTQSPNVFFIPDQRVEYKQHLLAAIQEAHHCIHIAMYACTVSWIWKALKDAAQRGVQVRVVLESTQIHPQKQMHAACKEGVSVFISQAACGSMHHKLICIDGVVWCGSMNLTPAGTWRHQENVVRIEDKLVSERAKTTFDTLIKTAHVYNA